MNCHQHLPPLPYFQHGLVPESLEFGRMRIQAPPPVPETEPVRCMHLKKTIQVTGRKIPDRLDTDVHIKIEFVFFIQLVPKVSLVTESTHGN